MPTETLVKIESNFETKEQSHAYCQSWKDFHKEGKHLKQVKEAWNGDTYKERDFECVHHLIYAVMRRKDVKNSFTPRLEHKCNGGLPYQAFYDAKNTIKAAASTRYPERYKYLLTPFNKTITMENIKWVAEQLESIKL